MTQPITTSAEAEQLPVGTILTIPPLGMITAEKRAGAFKNGRPGWYITGITYPVSDRGLFNYGRGWTVR